MRPGTPPSRSRLLELPGELRNQILKYVVTQPEPIDLYNPKASFSIELAVMYACKQLRDEARFPLYHENTLQVGIQTTGKRTYLEISRHHVTCEYRAKEAITEITSLFFDRFSRIQFRFADTRPSGALRETISTLSNCFQGKHLSIILPRPKETKMATQQIATTSRVSLYPRITSLLASFSLIRCALMSVSCPVPDYDVSQHDKLCELVTSHEPVVDMTREYEKAERSARNVVKMLIPDGCFQDYERLGDLIFDRLAAMCESANNSDQHAFLARQEEFQRHYQAIEELQWRCA